MVVPDLHGEHKVLERIVDKYIDREDVGFVFLGDVLDRKGIANDQEKGVFRTLDIIKNLGERAIVAIGNHEWYFLASIYNTQPDPKGIAIRKWIGIHDRDGVERNVVSSYGIDREGKRMEDVLAELKRRMSKVGHLAILASTTPYYETDCFIATHAGIDPTIPWEAQREQLGETVTAMNDGMFQARPPQWFSFDLAKNTDEIFHTNKIILSGHDHDPVERSLHDGKRIRLASELNPPYADPAVHVWRDWDRKIDEIPINSIVPQGQSLG